MLTSSGAMLNILWVTKVLLCIRNLIFKAQGTRKFLPKFIGPFPVQAIVNRVVVHMQLPHTNRIHPLFHVSPLRPYNVCEYTATPPPPLQVDAEGVYIYKHENVLAHKLLKQGRHVNWQFLIKWKGYGPEHSSWEPLSNIATP